VRVQTQLQLEEPRRYGSV